MRIEIHFAARDRLVDLGTRRALDVSDLGKAFCPQQLLRDVLRSVAERRGLHKAHRGDFERPLGGQRLRRSDAARGARQ